MNFFKLSLVATSLLLIGCGSSSNKSSTAPKATTVKDATKNIKALDSLKSLEKIGQSTTTKMQKLSKAQSVPCSGGGTMSVDISEDETTSTIVMNKCTQGDSYLNGTLTTIEQDNGYYKISINGLTVKQNNEETSATKLVMEGNDKEYWSTIDGDLKFKSSNCFSGTFDIKTLEKMYDMQDGSDGVRKGKLELNGATYTFDYPNVTIQVGGESKTMTQKELEKEMESTTSCNI